jgi:ABC-2 type transport system ATP-binding protein
VFFTPLQEELDHHDEQPGIGDGAVNFGTDILMISIRDLRVDYDNLCAVQDLTLTVSEGEVCGLIGPNGAGKTTTMRTLLGLIEPTFGQVEIMGIDVHEHPHEVARLVGFMPDFPPVYEDLLVWEFLDLFASSYRIPRWNRPDLVDHHLAMVGLEEKRDAPILELSRGMRQRLMLAKTLIPGPEVLLLDEPASGVDPQGRIDLKNILKRLSSEGKTILISSHILAEMNEFCTSVAIMERGRLVISGRIDEVNTRIMGDSTLAVEVLGETETFLRILADDQRAGPAERKGDSFEFRFRGGSEEASELLCHLVTAGVRVASFARRKENLEELFLTVGARELS